MDIVNFRISPEQRKILQEWIERHPQAPYSPPNTPATMTDAIRAAIDALAKAEARRERARAHDRTTARPRVTKQPSRA